MRSRAGLVIAGLVAVAAMTMAVVSTLQSAVPFVGPSELTPELDGRRVQVEGVVVAMSPEGDRLVLILSDFDGTEALVHYSYTGPPPLALEEGRLVVAKGTYRQGVVEAHQVSVRAHETPESP
jgi:cytochrome c-type biogenesis protein CcmE